jgi:hypothetical protein
MFALAMSAAHPMSTPIGRLAPKLGGQRNSLRAPRRTVVRLRDAEMRRRQEFPAATA